MKYEKPELSVIVLTEENIIRTSGGLDNVGDQPEGEGVITF